MKGKGSVTHRLLSLPLVGLHLQLQLVHQVLESADVLLVLLTLQEKQMSRGVLIVGIYILLP